MSLGKTLVLLGLVLVGVGLVVSLAPHVPWLGKLPGDLRIERGNHRLYLPITTSVLLSVLLTLLLTLLSKLR
jgi:hypothetical protein